MADQSNGNGSLNVSHPPAHDSTNSAASNAPNGGRGAPPQAGAPPPPTNGGPLAAAPVASHDPTLAPAVQPPPSTATTTTANSSTTAPHDPHHRLRSTSPLAPVQPPPPSLPAAPLDGPRPSLPPPRPEGFVQPSSYLRRPRGLSRPMPPEPPPQQPSPLPPPRAPPTSVDRDQIQGLVRSEPFSHILCRADDDGSGAQRKIRAFLKARTSYDVLPLSFRLIVFDTSLLVKNSLNILLQNGARPLPRPTRGRAETGRKWEADGRDRHRVGAAVGFQDLDLRRPAHDERLHQRHPVLLAAPGGHEPHRPVPAVQLTGCA